MDGLVGKCFVYMDLCPPQLRVVILDGEKSSKVCSVPSSRVFVPLSVWGLDIRYRRICAPHFNDTIFAFSKGPLERHELEIVIPYAGYAWECAGLRWIEFGWRFPFASQANGG
jgi:hypothetical protein